jgi:hypothetical protein
VSFLCVMTPRMERTGLPRLVRRLESEENASTSRDALGDTVVGSCWSLPSSGHGCLRSDAVSDWHDRRTTFGLAGEWGDSLCVEHGNED